MIEYASATPAGCLIISSSGKSSSVVYGSDYNVRCTENPSTPDNLQESNWVDAAFVILSDSDERIITSAINSLADRGITGKKLTTSKVALAVQRIERAMQNSTKAPRSFGEYDGTQINAKDEYHLSTRKLSHDVTPDVLEHSLEGAEPVTVFSVSKGRKGFERHSSDMGSGKGIASERRYEVKTRNEFGFYSPKYRTFVMI